MEHEPHNFILSNGIVSHNSHSNSYSYMSYWSQWFKCNFPLEFWTTSLNFAREEDIPKRISELKKLKQGLTLRPPSVNKSAKIFDCDHETQTIYWSISKIKGFGGEGTTVDALLKEREANGPFIDYNDFMNRKPSKVTKAHVMSLIVCGAFDEIEGINREIERFDLIKKHIDRLNSKIPNKKNWDQIPDDYITPDSIKNWYWIKLQRELTGYGDVDYRAILMGYSDKRIGKKLADLIVNGEQFDKAKNYTEASIGGIVMYHNVRTTKKNEKYLVLNIMSNNDLILLISWPDQYKENQEFLDACLHKTIVISGKIMFDAWRGQNVLFLDQNTSILEL